MSKNIDDDDVINNFLYMLENSKKPITQVKVKKNLPPIPRSYEPPINTLTNSRIVTEIVNTNGNIRRNAIKDIKDNNYPINSKKLKASLELISMTKDIGIPSIYFGFYFLPPELQDKYLTKDKESKESKNTLQQRGELRFDKLDPEGYREITKSEAYKTAMKKSDILTYYKATEYLKKNGFKNSTKEIIENENFKPNFSVGMFRNIADITTNPGGLPITLRTSTLRSQTIVKTDKKSDGIHLKVIKRYKLYDEFAKPYDLTNKGFPLGKETGTPYSMSDGYKSVALVDRVFENEKEAMQFMRRIVMQKASEKVR